MCSRKLISFELQGPDRVRLGPDRERLGPDRERLGPDRQRLGPDRQRLGPDRQRLGPDRQRLGPDRVRLGPSASILLDIIKSLNLTTSTFMCVCVCVRVCVPWFMSKACFLNTLCPPSGAYFACTLIGQLQLCLLSTPHRSTHSETTRNTSVWASSQ